ncbi:uncharacterized protein BDR25DRAFT_207392 [Lindgomyces ingoldianus]|uniref:Uncharacterized protein n=1 Tax=Lindgomyces ingoldianus TaxID=673940 RepID=A0ACB6RGW4_9PLEO|nr:uncharacterized protein BDR25DRAFT_207392 [Lindgomyces ingoldianus]KAF2478013.1 hypothetical protein BDR25DRAFT_207392 [Lindgomyces ingoldianus]
MSSAAKHNVIANPHPNVKPQHPTHICSSSAAAAPASRSFFDPWNSSSTGHQRAENRLSGSTSWRESRNLKLGEQYRRGLGGGERVADTVGAGSTEFGKGGRKENGLWEKGAKGLREGGQKSLAEVWGKRKAGRRNTIAGEKSGKLDSGMGEWRLKPEPEFPVEDAEGIEDENPPDSNQTSVSIPLHRQIFDGLCFYLNGSTAPLVSDHKLKHLLAERGGKLSIALGRRSVTHVILGRASSAGGAGGGLAATKIQKEITRVGGKGVKFIGAEWHADRRLPETRFSTLKLAPKGQNSVYGLFYAAKSRGEGREGATKD